MQLQNMPQSLDLQIKQILRFRKEHRKLRMNFQLMHPSVRVITVIPLHSWRVMYLPLQTTEPSMI